VAGLVAVQTQRFAMVVTTTLKIGRCQWIKTQQFG